MSYYGARFTDLPKKHPDDVVDQPVVINGLGSNTLSTPPTPTVLPTGSLTASASVNGATVITRFSGGIINTRYTITVVVPISNGERRAIVFTLDVK